MPTARVLDALQVLVPPPDDGDGECLRRFLAGRDEAAFAELVRRHGPMVYGACRRILANGPEADDAFQAAFFVLARKADTIRGNVRSWLYGVAVRVAHKARVQAVRRRVRQMAAAKPEAVLSPRDDRELWAVLDEELAKLPDDLRQAVLACDLNGLSRAKAAAELGWPEGTVAKRLTKAREELARRLTRRGISLGAGTLALALGERAAAAVPGALLAETARQAASFALGGQCSLAARALAESALRSLAFGAKAWLAVGLLALALAGGGWMFAGAPGEPTGAPPAAAKPEPIPAGTIWKERYLIENEGKLPTSVAYSADGQNLLAGFADSEVMSLVFDRDDAKWKWKATVVEAVPAAAYAVAYSADRKKVYATTRDGVRVIDASTGKQEAVIEAKGSNPTALGVFPNKAIAPDVTRCQIVFGNASGYFVKGWADGKMADTIGTIQTSTVAKGATPADAAAVPLAVDPKGRSAIMTGPLDGATKKNVLWAYVCGDYEKDSPGNRVMPGHEATVVSAAWAKDGATAVTGDAAGRVIAWDAKSMKELRRVELGGRIAALAITGDGSRTAAYVLGKAGEVFVWDTAKPTNAMKPIHTDPSDFSGVSSHASLSFTPDGKRLAGCAFNARWLSRLAESVGKVRVWELAEEPRAQRPPKTLFALDLPKGAAPNFAVYSRHSLIMKATGKEGAIDFRDLRDGSIQQRLTLGQFSIGRMTISPDRKWLALETHPPNPGAPAKTFDLYLLDLSKMIDHKTIPTCDRLLDLASGHVAVVRNGAIELWDIATAKLKKSAPFPTKRVDAAALSPDGNTLAVSDRNELVLWRWTENAHERIDLGHTVGSLAFSPDGKTLAEGPSPRDAVRLRNVATRKIERSLFNGTKQSLDVPRMAFAQGGRLLIAANAIQTSNAVPHRIHFWDTLTGGVAHEIAIPNGFPRHLDLTPSGRTLIAAIERDAGVTLMAWEIDGDGPAAQISEWKEGKPLSDFPSWPVRNFALNADGRQIAVVAGGYHVSIHDSADGTTLSDEKTHHLGALKAPATRTAVAFSARGDLAVTAQNGVVVYRADTLLKPIPEIVGSWSHWEGVRDFDPHQVAWLANDRIVAGSGDAYHVLGWNVVEHDGITQTERYVGDAWKSREKYKHLPTALAVSAQSKRILYLEGSKPVLDVENFNLLVRRTDTSPQKIHTLAGHTSRPTGGAIASDGSRLLTGAESGELILWDGTTFQKRSTRKLAGSIANVALAGDDRTAAVLCVGERGEGDKSETDWNLYVFDIATGERDLKPAWSKTLPGSYSNSIHRVRTDTGVNHSTLAFHPNGSKLYASLAEPYTRGLKRDDPNWRKPTGIRVWEKPAPAPAADTAPAARREIRELRGTEVGGTEPQGVAFAPDGKSFSVVDGDGLVSNWDRATLKKLWTYDAGHGNALAGLDHSATRNELAVVNGNELHAIDAGTGKLVRPAAKTPAFAVQYAHDGVRLAFANGKYLMAPEIAPIVLTDPASALNPVAPLYPCPIAWSPDDARIAVLARSPSGGDSSQVLVWSAKEKSHRRLESAVAPKTLYALRWSRDGKRIFAGGDDARILIWSGDKLETQTAIDTGGWKVRALALAPNDAVVFAGLTKLENPTAPPDRWTRSAKVVGYELATGKPIFERTLEGDAAYALALDPSGRALVVFGGVHPMDSGDSTWNTKVSRVELWEDLPRRDPAPAKLSWKAEAPIADPQFDLRSPTFSKDGSKFAVCSNGQSLVFDATTLKKLYTVDGCFPRFVDDSLFTWALVAKRFDAKTGKELKEFPQAKTEFGWRLAAFAPDGQTVAGYDGAQVQLRDVATGFEPRRLERQARPTNLAFPIQGVNWSPDGKFVAGFHAAAELDGVGGLAIWDAATGRQTARRSAGLLEFNGRHAGFAFAPDGKTLAVGGLTGDNERNSSLAILDATTLKTVTGPILLGSREDGAVVTAVAVSPDGGTVALGVKLLSGKAPLNRIHLYDAKTLSLRESLLPSHDTAPISSLAFAPDGRTLVAATGEGPYSDPQQKETLHRVLVWRGEEKMP